VTYFLFSVEGFLSRTPPFGRGNSLHHGREWVLWRT